MNSSFIIGVPKGRIARVSIWMIPVKIGTTMIITRWTVGPRPMNVWLWCFPFRILLALAYMVLVYVTPLYQTAGNFLILYWWSAIVLLFICVWMYGTYWYLNLFSFNRWHIPSRILCSNDFHFGGAPGNIIWNVCGNNGFLCKSVTRYVKKYIYLHI